MSRIISIHFLYHSNFLSNFWFWGPKWRSSEKVLDRARLTRKAWQKYMSLSRVEIMSFFFGLCRTISFSVYLPRSVDFNSKQGIQIQDLIPQNAPQLTPLQEKGFLHTTIPSSANPVTRERTPPSDFPILHYRAHSALTSSHKTQFQTLPSPAPSNLTPPKTPYSPIPIPPSQTESSSHHPLPPYHKIPLPEPHPPNLRRDQKNNSIAHAPAPRL